MKKLLFLTLILNCFSIFAEHELRPEREPFQVISDTFDAKIPKGKCLIEGTIYDNYTGEKLKNVTVLSGSKIITSDKMGYFKVVQTLTVTHLKFSKKGYKECYMEDYAFQNQHHIKVRIYIKNELEQIHYEVKKPVIYCYSDKDISFNFKFKPKGDLLFSYPKTHTIETLLDIKSNTWEKNTFLWSMELKNNHLINSSDEAEYPYLFWESVQYNVHYKMNVQPAPKRGFDAQVTYPGQLVSRDDILLFLDTTLSNLGFNSREKTDFITFWTPQMQKASFYLIQFLQDEECELFASYEIEPKPSKVNRFYMLFSGFDQNSTSIKTIPQELKKLERSGFYMLDWGGVQVPLQENLDLNFEELKN